ncbi:MAG: hypothetical protein V4568_01035 [Pseudomonadota bacterium]
MRFAIIALLVATLCRPAFAGTTLPDPNDKSYTFTPATAIPPDAVMDLINTLSPRGAVELLNSDSSPFRWTAVLQSISTGTSEWLDVAKELSYGVNAVTAADLQVSLAAALTQNPAGVLSLVDKNLLTVPFLCTGPFSDPAFLPLYLRDTKKALESIREPMVERYRVECLGKLEEAMTIQKALSEAALPDEENNPDGVKPEEYKKEEMKIEPPPLVEGKKKESKKRTGKKPSKDAEED